MAARSVPWEFAELTLSTSRSSSPRDFADRSHGTAIEQLGWKVLDVGEARPPGESDDALLPSGLEKDQPQRVLEAKAVPKRTRPPPRLNDATLLTAMETAGKTLDEKELSDAMKESGLGTPATRASIIETLLTRGYVLRDGKALQATERGIGLIAVVDAEVKSAAMTGEWEARLQRIARGDGELGAFIQRVEQYVEAVVRRVPPHLPPLGGAPPPGGSQRSRPSGSTAARPPGSNGAHQTQLSFAVGANSSRPATGPGPNTARSAPEQSAHPGTEARVITAGFRGESRKPEPREHGAGATRTDSASRMNGTSGGAADATRPSGASRTNGTSGSRPGATRPSSAPDTQLGLTTEGPRAPAGAAPPPGTLDRLLRDRFGFSSFRPHQRAVCEAAAEGTDLLLVMRPAPENLSATSCPGWRAEAPRWW